MQSLYFWLGALRFSVDMVMNRDDTLSRPLERNVFSSRSFSDVQTVFAYQP